MFFSIDTKMSESESYFDTKCYGNALKRDVTAIMDIAVILTSLIIDRTNLFRGVNCYFPNN